LNYAVIKLNDEYVLLMAASVFRNKLSLLDFVRAELPFKVTALIMRIGGCIIRIVDRTRTEVEFAAE